MAGVLALIGVSGVPDDLRTWGAWLQGVSSDEGRWMLTILGLGSVAAVQFLTSNRPKRPSVLEEPEPPTKAPVPSRQQGTPFWDEVRPRFTNEGERIFTDATPEVLTGFYRAHMKINAAKLAEPHLGTWITVSGPLGNVGSPIPSGRSQVTFARPHDPFRPDAVTMYMWFEDQWIERLSVMEPNHEITVVGWIDRIESDNLQLSDCELVGE